MEICNSHWPSVRNQWNMQCILFHMLIFSIQFRCFKLLNSFVRRVLPIKDVLIVVECIRKILRWRNWRNSACGPSYLRAKILIHPELIEKWGKYSTRPSNRRWYPRVRWQWWRRLEAGDSGPSSTSSNIPNTLLFLFFRKISRIQNVSVPTDTQTIFIYPSIICVAWTETHF